jgi:hypothetical protein
MSKNFLKDGRWIEKTAAPKVLVCTCGNKYIKTRLRQKLCLQCIGELTRA